MILCIYIYTHIVECRYYDMYIAVYILYMNYTCTHCSIHNQFFFWALIITHFGFMRYQINMQGTRVVKMKIQLRICTVSEHQINNPSLLPSLSIYEILTQNSVKQVCHLFCHEDSYLSHELNSQIFPVRQVEPSPLDHQ